jgi:prophage regulatory protein
MQCRCSAHQFLDRELEKATMPQPVAPIMQDGDRKLFRCVRRKELRRLVPLADTTIYETERRAEFPRRFLLTPRCVAWELAEIEEWLRQWRKASDELPSSAPGPDVRLRRTRPVS